MRLLRGHVVLPFVAALAGGALLQVTLPLLPRRAGLLLMAGLLTVIAAAAGVGHLRRSRSTRGRARVGWALVALISALWAVTNAFWFPQLLLDFPETRPKPSDYAASLAILLIPGALVLLTPSAGGPRVRLWRLIDGATISASLVFLSWRFVVEPVLDRVDAQLRWMIGVAPMLEIVSCALALVALSRSRSQDGRALIQFEASLVVFSIATLVEIYNVAFGLARFAGGVGGAYLAATLLLAMASRSSLPAEAPPDAAGGDGRWAWLPYLPVGICFLAAAYLQSRDGALDPVLFWVLLCIAALVLIRQFLHLQTNRALLRRVDEQRARLAHLAFHDPLTGLANRALLSDRASETLAAADGTTALILLDLDGFKAVNDTYGHGVGDELLRQIATRLVRCVRDDDLVVRLGGDEFVIFMPRLSDAAEAAAMGIRILEELARPVTIAGHRVLVHGSAGMAVTHGSVTVPDGLLRDADAALYEAKSAGKNRLCQFGGTALGAAPTVPEAGTARAVGPEAGAARAVGRQHRRDAAAPWRLSAAAEPDTTRMSGSL